MKANYYNESDPFAAAWLRELICEEHIPFGVVDERSIEDIAPAELDGYTQVHFFAGVGGWSLALRLAGWPDDRPVWTGSCPCQPFSAAGKGNGFDDERHLWPSWFHLIRECRPSVIFGEQVEAAIKHSWLDLVQDDLEGEGYAFGATGLPAACVGAPHIRQRLWFVADSISNRWDAGRNNDTEYDRSQFDSSCVIGTVADGNNTRLERRSSMQQCSIEQSPWQNSLVNWARCSDGKARPIEPSIQPLAHGIPNRVGILRGAGNAIVPQVAAEVIRAYMSC